MEKSESLKEADWQAARSYPERAAISSPVIYLSRDDPPFIIFHSEKEIIDVSIAKWFSKDIEALHRNDKTIIIPGELHGFSIMWRLLNLKKLAVNFSMNI